MDVWEVGVLSKSKLLQLQIVKCETSIDDADIIHDADATVHDADVDPLDHDHNDQYLFIGFLIIMETW